jgi:hypothetical protein
VLGRIGGAAIVVALAALAFAATLALTGQARAAGSDTIQIKMPGQASFTSGSTRPLLDTDGLGPGGSVTGSMLVRDNSGESLGSDSVYLTMINVRPSDGCTAGGSGCAGSGWALSDALRFQVDVSDPETGVAIRHSAETVASLQRGVLLGSRLSDGDVVEVRLTASLPFRSTGNAVQYGGLGFNLRLDLISVAGESGSTGNNGGSGDGHPGTPAPGDGGLVIGGDQSDLATTGTPVRPIVGTAAVLLVLGLLLMIGARTTRRNVSQS